MHIKRIAALFLSVCLVAAGFLPARATEAEDTKPYIERMLTYCMYYGDEAESDILYWLGRIERADPEQGKTWRSILERWGWAYGEMALHENLLPDGLPEDDSLCIMVMGYSLTKVGKPRPELIGRLEVALACAEKYPKAYIVCTGGATSYVPGVTEAGVMKDWLVEQGIEESRILTETEAMSTTQNVQKVYKLLLENYPQVKHMAVVTSDYHITRSCMMWDVMGVYASAYDGWRVIDLVGNAYYPSGNTGDQGRNRQAQGIGILAGVDLENAPRPALSKLESLSVGGETDYEVGEPLALTITAHYDSGITRDVTELAMPEGFDPNTPGTQTLSGTYMERGEVASWSQDVRVAPAGETLPPLETGAATQPTAAEPTVPAGTEPPEEADGGLDMDAVMEALPPVPVLILVPGAAIGLLAWLGFRRKT